MAWIKGTDLVNQERVPLLWNDRTAKLGFISGFDVGITYSTGGFALPDAFIPGLELDSQDLGHIIVTQVLHNHTSPVIARYNYATNKMQFFTTGAADSPAELPNGTGVRSWQIEMIIVTRGLVT